MRNPPPARRARPLDPVLISPAVRGADASATLPTSFLRLWLKHVGAMNQAMSKGEGKSGGLVSVPEAPTMASPNQRWELPAERIPAAAAEAAPRASAYNRV